MVPQTKVFVGSLPPGSKPEELRRLFERFGTVTECDVMNRCGFVHMETEEMASTAIRQLNNTNFNGGVITVERGRIKERSSGGGPRQGGGQGGGRGPMRNNGMGWGGPARNGGGGGPMGMPRRQGGGGPMRGPPMGGQRDGGAPYSSRPMGGGPGGAMRNGGGFNRGGQGGYSDDRGGFGMDMGNGGGMGGSFGGGNGFDSRRGGGGFMSDDGRGGMFPDDRRGNGGFPDNRPNNMVIDRRGGGGGGMRPQMNMMASFDRGGAPRGNPMGNGGGGDMFTRRSTPQMGGGNFGDRDNYSQPFPPMGRVGGGGPRGGRDMGMGPRRY